jgi:hypothetical protein
MCPNLDFWFENKPSGNPDPSSHQWMIRLNRRNFFNIFSRNSASSNECYAEFVNISAQSVLGETQDSRGDQTAPDDNRYPPPFHV